MIRSVLSLAMMGVLSLFALAGTVLAEPPKDAPPVAPPMPPMPPMPQAFQILTDQSTPQMLQQAGYQVQTMQANGEPFAGQPIRDVVTVNGVRVTVADGTWGLLRASSNKPELVVVVESPVSEARMRECDRLKDPEDAADPRTGKRAIDNFEAFMKFLAPLARGPITDEARTGEQVFGALGCASEASLVISAT